MTQEQIDVLYKMMILIHEHEWFGERKKMIDRNELQEWIAKSFANHMGVYTIPDNMSWGTLTTKEKFDKYWKLHGKVILK